MRPKARASRRPSVNWDQPILVALEGADPKPRINASAPDKKNYAERLSRHLARVLADGLRAKFPKVTPDSAGGSQESLVGADSGHKKLDVKAWDDQLGLVLSVSIKTYSFA